MSILGYDELGVGITRKLGFTRGAVLTHVSLSTRDEKEFRTRANQKGVMRARVQTTPSSWFINCHKIQRKSSQEISLQTFTTYIFAINTI